MMQSQMPKETKATALHAVRLALVLKGAVGFSVAVLALFGIVVPYIGPALGVAAHPTVIGGGVAASIGALLGVVAAARA